MSKLIEPPPHTPIELVTDLLHGAPVNDPYRWLEDPNSFETRSWIEKQTRYSHTYLGSLPGRERIREVVRDLLDRETYDSFFKVGNRYFFRKRLPGEEQPSIYMREGSRGKIDFSSIHRRVTRTRLWLSSRSAFHPTADSFCTRSRTAANEQGLSNC